MSVISDGAVKFGKVTVDKETGRTKIAQQVNGVDIGTTIDEIKKAKLALTDIQQDKIDTNTKSIAALAEFQKKLLSLNLSISQLANRVGANKQTVMPVFNNKAVKASTPAYARFKASSGANTGNHTLVVSQMASYDNYKTTISAPLSSTALNLTGSIKIGTGNPDTLKQIDITTTQSLSDVVSSINSWSSQTGVTAEVSLVSSGTPNNTYQLRLTAKETGTPLIFEDVTGNILGSWNLIHGREASHQSGNIPGNNTSTNIGATGTLRVQAQDGTEVIVSLAGLSLDGIKSALDAVEGTSKVHAEIIPIYALGAASASLPTHHQLKLTTTSGQPLIISNSDGTALTDLKLDTFITKSLNTSISTTNVNADQGITGDLKIKAASGAEVTIATAGKSLKQIEAEINTYTATHNIAARLQLVTAANPSVADSKSIYQLTIYTPDNTQLEVNNSDPSVITGLNLNKPTNDYQTIISKFKVDDTEYERKTNRITNILTGIAIDLVSESSGVETAFDVAEDPSATADVLQDFLNLYNDLTEFYNKQTAASYNAATKTLEPAEGADLWDNQYIKNFMANFKRTLASSVVIKEDGLTKAMDLESLGLDIYTSDKPNDYENGFITVTDKDKLSSIFTDRFDAIAQFLGNKILNTNANFTINASPFVLENDVRGKDIDITLERTGPATYDAKARIGGIDYELAVNGTDNVIPNPQLTLTAPTTGPLKGMKFTFGGTLTNPGGVTTTKINIKPGIMADMDGLILKTTDTSKNPNDEAADYVMGDLLQEVKILSNKNNKLSESIAKKKEEIAKEMEGMEAKFNRVYEAQSKYKEVQMMLASWSKSNER